MTLFHLYSQILNELIILNNMINSDSALEDGADVGLDLSK